MADFGEIRTAGVPDSEISEKSYIQSHMHFDDSVESTADSDLEDAELQKMRTSPLYAQKVSEKPDAMVMQEREKERSVHNALKPIEKDSLTSLSSEGQKASGKSDALFSS